MAYSETRTERLLRVVATLMKSEGISPRILQEAGGISADAAKQDLRLLRKHFPLRVVGRGRQQRWILDETLSGQRSLAAAISLTVGRQVASFLEGTDLYDGLDRAGQDNSRFMGRGRSDHLDRKFICKREPARSYQEHADVLNDCLTALVYGKELALSYAGRSGRREYAAFWPLSLVVYRRALYLLGRSDGEDQQPMAIERIERVTIGERFAYPSDWNPEAHLGPIFGIVRNDSPRRHVFRFDPSVADLVHARVWGPEQVLTTLPDGRVQLEIVASGGELRRFALEWGRCCEVVEPLDLRAEVRDELERALAHYDTPSP